MKQLIKKGMLGLAVLAVGYANAQAEEDKKVTKFEIPKFVSSTPIGSYIDSTKNIYHFRLEQMTETQGNLLYRVQRIIDNGTVNPSIQTAWLDDKMNMGKQEVIADFRAKGIRSLNDYFPKTDSQ